MRRRLRIEVKELCLSLWLSLGLWLGEQLIFVVTVAIVRLTHLGPGNRFFLEALEVVLVVNGLDSHVPSGAAIGRVSLLSQRRQGRPHIGPRL